jgi:hypothetical protein
MGAKVLPGSLSLFCRGSYFNFVLYSNFIGVKWEKEAFVERDPEIGNSG